MRTSLEGRETARASWWVGLDRAQFGQEIARREAGWRVLKQAYLDHIGAQMVGDGGPIVRRPKRDA